MVFLAHSAFFRGLFGRGALSVSPPPRHTGGTRQDFDEWLTTGSLFPSIAFLRVFLTL